MSPRGPHSRGGATGYNALSVLLLRLQAPRSRPGRAYSQVRRGEVGESPSSSFATPVAACCCQALPHLPPAVHSFRTQPLHLSPQPMFFVLHVALPSIEQRPPPMSRMPTLSLVPPPSPIWQAPRPPSRACTAAGTPPSPASGCRRWRPAGRSAPTLWSPSASTSRCWRGWGCDDCSPVSASQATKPSLSIKHPIKMLLGLT